jgi:hypothetical protein
MTPVPFVELAEWRPVGYRDVWVWVAFDERLVATGERHGPDDHAGVWTVSAFLPKWSDRLAEHGWEWLAPLIRRLAADEDPASVRPDAVREYAGRNDGAEPAVTEWTLDLDRYP